ncbi:transcriptional regulator [Acinetobacter wuhouensis]|uniref:Transcriptional regulator n=2 Tax=Acinetobacter TaxID=469 RepID=A0A385C3N8_9GAMM|nr:transcriptional regulator [Acinetobacter wuhouensis]AXQ22347.1 transcriptional regulator [Acinetobacter wuhouensis]AYO54434.1 transcriptional regulator [Acinetobacter wuhouensis]
MNIKPIRNDDDLTATFIRLESIFQAENGTPEADEREVLVTLIEAYENKHYPIAQPDPIEAIKCRMIERNMTPKDLEPYLGGQSRVSEVLNRKRGLSLRMMKQLHHNLNISYDTLMAAT